MDAPHAHLFSAGSSIHTSPPSGGKARKGVIYTGNGKNPVADCKDAIEKGGNGASRFHFQKNAVFLPTGD
ncbi:MAG TPA: hypothetical protein DDZ11_02440 [Lentisphaeria bacterium]|nr:hypothetical protein [Lentisphaeria bacterium]